MGRVGNRSMAICANCGHDISNGEAFCPSCGKPIAGIEAIRREKSSLVRQGAIVGLIGYAGLALIAGILGFFYVFGEPSQPSHPSLAGAIKDMESDLHGEQMLQGATPFLLFVAVLLMVGLVCFVIGFVRANDPGRSRLIALSSICLALSLVTLVVAFAWLNIMLLCMGWMVGWQPVLMTVGAYKMLSASLKMPKDYPDAAI